VGWSDLPADLSDQAALAHISAHLPDQAVLVSSDLSRAIATADAIQGARSRLPHDPALREMHFGTWELRAYAEIEAEDSHLIRAFWDEPGDVRPPGGESWNTLIQRVNPAIDRLVANHLGQDIIVVAHFGTILSQLQRAKDLTPYKAFGHRIEHLSVTEILFDDKNGWQVGGINRRP